MALRTTDGLAICNKDDYDFFFDNYTNNDMKNPYSDQEVEKIVDEWEDLILGNDTFWDMYWDMLREAVNEHSRKIAEQCQKV